MAGKRMKNMENIISNKLVNISISLEDYIPLKVLINRTGEPVKTISYFKGKTSLLEITVGITSGFIKRVALLLSKEFEINDSKLNIDVYEIADLKVNDELKNCCVYFITHLYDDGIRIVISESKVIKYVKMDRLFVGLSNLGSIVEICLCQLTPSEIEHIKNELNYQ